MSIDILLPKFLDHLLVIRGYSKATVVRYKGVLTHYVRLASISSIQEVSQASVRELFFHGRTVKQWQPGTCSVVYKALKVFFKWCQKEGLLSFDPTADVELPRPAKKLPQNLTVQDAFRLLEVVYNYPYEFNFLRYRNHAIFATFLFAGLRLQELLNLKLTDVDVENLTISVRQGKGNKDRIVPMASALAHSITRYLEQRKQHRKTCPELFTSSNHNCGYTLSGLKRLVLKIRAASGIRFTIHKLRHTFATLMWDNGCDIYALSRMLGHSSVETTKIYVHASVSTLRSHIAKHPLNSLVQ